MVKSKIVGVRDVPLSEFLRNCSDSLFDKVTERMLVEFQADLGKVFVVMMGLPAAGKSSWLQREVGNYLPGFPLGSTTTANSDHQVLARQRALAQEHFDWLSGKDDPEDITDFRTMTRYTDNDGIVVTHPLTWEWWTAAPRNSGEFWSTFYKAYYARRFDIRPSAKEDEQALFGDKLVKSSRYFVWDTVAASTGKVLGRLTAAKVEGFTTVIVYLEIDPAHCVVRDQFRKASSGRSVGPTVIYQHAGRMNRAFQVYSDEGRKPDGVIDRALHFVWHGSADPRTGKFVQVSDTRFHVKRDIAAMRAGKTAELVADEV